MESELQKELIEFFEWVEQWYYTPESLARIEAMKSRVVAQQGVEPTVIMCDECGTKKAEYHRCFDCIT